MANSASDAGNSEKDIRQKLVDDGLVDVMVAVGPNMFYNVTLPVTLWFIDKSKKNTGRRDTILFIDARNIFKQIDRAHREWTDEQVEQITKIVRSYRQEKGSVEYKDIKGLCRVATLKEVVASEYSLSPGRYVKILEKEMSNVDFGTQITKLMGEFTNLTNESGNLEKKIHEDLRKIL